MNKKDDPKSKGEKLQNSAHNQSRRDFLKTSAVVAGTSAASMAIPKVSAAAKTESEPSNPYGARPGGGISLPDYYKPWAAIKNRNFYAPGTEILPKNEMRISFLGRPLTPLSYAGVARRTARRVSRR